MRARSYVLATLLTGFSLAATWGVPPGSGSGPERFCPVAVLDFECSVEEAPELGSQVGTLLTAFLSSREGIDTVERNDLERILEEQELGISGTVTRETAATLGRLTGAKILVVGRVFRVGSEMLIVSKTMGTETGRVFGDFVSTHLEDSVTPAVEELAEKISARILSPEQKLLAELETREDLVARLRAQIGDRPRPVLIVTIEERHIGAPDFDPTAETEVRRLLQELGFALVDPERAATRAEVEIRGRALSEFGTRRGNLVSCRGSVEIEAVDKKSGTILVADRQSEVSVDLAERTAAQTALARCAARLVERMVERLIDSP